MKKDKTYWIRHIGYVASLLGSIIAMKMIATSAEPNIDMALFIWALVIAFISAGMIIVDR